MLKSASALFAILLTCGCGARVELATDDAGPDVVASDTESKFGPGGSIDAASPADATTPTDVGPTDLPPSIGWGEGPRITSIDACGSSATVDKLIAHTDAPLAPFPTPAPIDVIPGGGTKCETLDARSPTGEYAFSGKCGLVDKSKRITVVIRDGIKATDGRPMQPGTHVFVPTSKAGRLCGIAFMEM